MPSGQQGGARGVMSANAFTRSGRGTPNARGFARAGLDTVSAIGFAQAQLDTVSAIGFAQAQPDTPHAIGFARAQSGKLDAPDISYVPAVANAKNAVECAATACTASPYLAVARASSETGTASCEVADLHRADRQDTLFFSH
ncbi:hypothetical protein [Paraburkholderia caffeinilytica]|uniref:hypothetical protein n=1 Tax=Paraburkholderia caffeinilytica TaxID=1761016 RepID=UPI003DA06207